MQSAVRPSGLEVDLNPGDPVSVERFQRGVRQLALRVNFEDVSWSPTDSLPLRRSLS